MDQILLNGMEFFGHHGCSEAERQRGQVFCVDAELFLDLSKSGKSDNIEDTVDYSKVFNDIRTIVSGPPKNLIEAVAEEVASKLLAKYPLLNKVKITIHKPSAPLQGIFDNAAVSIIRGQ